MILHIHKLSFPNNDFYNYERISTFMNLLAVGTLNLIAEIVLFVLSIYTLILLIKALKIYINKNS